ncbi:MAG: poly-gamma-glutamate capsule biosynthesis protein CapA/YwtB (metallophosphatase superfamily) [Myxococcota bacterium]|jgi:poly-gamma-glutamate capsule biosynthesis protein CapA/YwtB (metallophosphatase superfamily)
MMSVWLFTVVALATPEADLTAGMAAQRAGDAAAAVVHYESCLAVVPAHVACHWELGWSLWTLGQWADVVKHWQRVAELEPSHPEVGKHLPTAEGHLASMTLARSVAAGAPTTLRPPLPEGRTLRLRAAGDIMLGTDFPHPTDYLPPEDGAQLLAGVTPWLSDADVTFGNLEGPLCDGGSTHKCGEDATACYAFRSPTRYADHLKAAGFDMLSTANNHAEDFGVECRIATEQALAERGLAASGRPGTIATVEVDGASIGMIGFHTNRNSHYVNDHETAAALVRAVAAQHDWVVVSFHGGAEGSKALHVPDGAETFYGENRGHLRAFARAVIGAGADIVLGHGPHVPRGMEIIDGHLVAYSLGNFATYGRFGLSGHLSTSLVLEAVLDADGRLVRGQILPVRLLGKGVPMPDDAGTATDLVRQLSSEDFPTTSPVIALDGTLAPR